MSYQEIRETCYNCGEKSDNINPQTGLCPHCLELFCRKCRNCGLYYMREDRYCHACYTGGGHEDVKRDAIALSSGKLATLTGKRTYAELEAIQAEFIAFVEQHPGQYETWVNAWQDFREKGLR